MCCDMVRNVKMINIKYTTLTWDIKYMKNIIEVFSRLGTYRGLTLQKNYLCSTTHLRLVCFICIGLTFIL